MRGPGRRKKKPKGPGRMGRAWRRRENPFRRARRARGRRARVVLGYFKGPREDERAPPCSHWASRVHSASPRSTILNRAKPGALPSPTRGAAPRPAPPCCPGVLRRRAAPPPGARRPPACMCFRAPARAAPPPKGRRLNRPRGARLFGRAPRVPPPSPFSKASRGPACAQHDMAREPPTRADVSPPLFPVRRDKPNPTAATPRAHATSRGAAGAPARPAQADTWNRDPPPVVRAQLFPGFSRRPKRYSNGSSYLFGLATRPGTRS